MQPGETVNPAHIIFEGDRNIQTGTTAELAKTRICPYMTPVSCMHYMFHGNFHCFTEISGREGEGEDGASKKSTNYTDEISTG